MKKNGGIALRLFSLLLCITLLLILAVLFQRSIRARRAKEDAMLQRAEDAVQALQKARTSEEETEGKPSAGTGVTGGIPSGNGQESALEEHLPDAETETESEMEDFRTAHAPVIFVGDSRTVGMGTAEAEMDDGCVYIGESGEGLAWFSETGIEWMSDAIRDMPNAPVVINLGVNDLEEIDNYLALYVTFSSLWPATDFYFLSVNPVTSESEHVKNGDIVRFNARMKRDCPFPYLDSFTWMIVHRFESVDGVHYSEDTYRDIHDFVVRSLAEKDASSTTRNR